MSHKPASTAMELKGCLMVAHKPRCMQCGNTGYQQRRGGLLGRGCDPRLAGTVGGGPMPWGFVFLQIGNFSSRQQGG